MLTWFACPLGPCELQLSTTALGDPKGQTTWEALTVFIALLNRAPDFERQDLASIAVRSDSLGTLHAAGPMSSTDVRLNKITQELALDMFLLNFEFDLLSHANRSIISRVVSKSIIGSYRTC